MYDLGRVLLDAKHVDHVRLCHCEDVVAPAVRYVAQGGEIE